MNHITLTGNLGRDVELKYTQNGAAIGNGNIAVKRKFAKEGFQDTDWIMFKALGKQAEVMAQYLSKGSKVLIEGSYQVDQYEKDGEKKSYNYILVNSFEFLDSKKKDKGTDINPDDDFSMLEDDSMDDIPF